MGGRGSNSGMSRGGGGAKGKTTPNGLNYGGANSEIDINADPKNVDKINDRFMRGSGFSLEEAISEVSSVIRKEKADEFTLDYLKEQLPKMINATIKMKDVKEVMDIALR